MSTHASTKIDQKEYLKKYLSGDSKEKKKKKRDKKQKTKGATSATVKIYDDDEVQPGTGQTIDEELLLTGDDAPQIVGEYVEERGPNGEGANKWRSIVVKEEPTTDESKVKIEKEEDLWGRKAFASKIRDQFSPPRRKIKEEEPRQRTTPDISPPRRRRSNDNSPRRKKSPKRSNRNENENKNNWNDNSPRRIKTERKKSAERKSPPRRKQPNENSVSPRRRRKSSSDQSPPRKGAQSPPQRHRSRSPDQSPPRRRRERRDSDQSPERRRRIKRENETPPRVTKIDAASPPRRRSRWTQAASPSPPPTHKPKQATITLGDKNPGYGLQDAQALHTETSERRRREERLFEQMPSGISGRDAEVQVRSTGRRGQRARDAAAQDPAEQRRKEEHEERKRDLYDRWGKGLKQIEDHRARCAEQQHEGAKPLARYSNDEDLERHLREQERIDDPMLEYIRAKHKERQRDARVPEMPAYQGAYPENRFGIPPGYRWDGVDRSNGYERKWFDVQNEKRARQEEAYKYSVEDM